MRHRILGRQTSTTIARSAALAIAGSLTLAGCVSGPSQPSASPHSTEKNSSGPSGPAEHVIQSRWLPWVSDRGIRVDVTGLNRISNDVTVLHLRLTNYGKDTANYSGVFADIDGDSDSYSGTGLLDGTGMKAYYPWTSGNGPLSTEFIPALYSGHSMNATILYPGLPPNVSKVDISAPGLVPFTDIPVQQGGKLGSNDPTFNKSDVAKPDVRRLRATKEDLDGNKAEDDSGDKVDIRISSDVLFKLNKADLTPKANAILKTVAQRLDQSKAASISVDGYTDSSGNDAINNPLSKRRAAAVQKALQKLVTRKGITYKVAGHGSADPVASNSSATGRKKNRRVTVTFSK